MKEQAPLQKKLLTLNRPIELALKHNAIVVSPAYRLLPEANGTDVLEDVADFWSWVRESLPAEVAARFPHIHVDIDRTAVFGESAGGYLTLMSAFHHSEANIKLLMPHYCAMFPDSEAYASRTLPSSPETEAIAEGYLRSLKPGAIRIHEPYWDFMPTSHALMGRKKTAFMGNDERLTLAYSLRTVKNLPPTWVIQGADDDIVSFHILQHS